MGTLDGKVRDRHRRRDAASAGRRRCCWPRRAPTSSSTTSTATEARAVVATRSPRPAAPREANADDVSTWAGAEAAVDRGRRLRRPPRRPGEQRRHPARRDELLHGRGPVGRRDPGPPQGPRRLRPLRRARTGGTGPRPARTVTRPHHQHRARVGALRPGRPGQLRRGQGRHRVDDGRAGPRAKQVRRDGERDRPPGPHPHDRDGARRRCEPAEGAVRRVGPGQRRPGGGVAGLATPRRTSRGQVFVVNGDKVHLMSGWHRAGRIDNGGRRWTVGRARRPAATSCSASRTRACPPMGFGE